MKKVKKTKKVTNKKTGLLGMIDSIGDAFMDSDIAIKINNHEIFKDKKNNIAYSVTKNNIRTSVQFADKRFGFERCQVEPFHKPSEQNLETAQPNKSITQ
jgi:hypothetical protein